MAGLIKRGKNFYLTYQKGGKEFRRSLGTNLLQVAKDKLRQFESRIIRGDDNPLPTKTPLPEIIDAYVQHMRVSKTSNSAQKDIYILQQAFGQICAGLRTSRKAISKSQNWPERPDADKRYKLPVIEAKYLEEITPRHISEYISSQVQVRGFAPKTANRHREVLHALFNWAITERGIRIPQDKNPVAAVKRYREKTPKITYLTMKQIEEQLDALEKHPQVQMMIAMYIYAGLRREEALWLQRSDIDFNAGPFGMIRIQAKEVNGEFWEPKTKKNRAVPITSTALANTGMSINMNQKSKADISVATNALLLKSDEKHYLGKLPVGYAIIKLQHRWFEPFLVKFPLMKIRKGTIKDDHVRDWMQRYSEVFRPMQPVLLGTNPSSSIPPAEKEGVTKQEYQLLESVHENQVMCLTEHYKMLNFSRRKGNDIKIRILEKNLAIEQKVNMSYGYKKLLKTTEKGKKLLEVNGESNGTSSEHRYWHNKAAKYYESKEFEVKKNYMTFDLLISKGNLSAVVEIETGKSNPIKNIKDAIDAGYPVVSAATNQKAFQKIKKQLIKENLDDFGDIHVVDDPDGKYLRTDPDKTTKNNLDELPDC